MLNSKADQNRQQATKLWLITPMILDFLTSLNSSSLFSISIYFNFLIKLNSSILLYSFCDSTYVTFLKLRLSLGRLINTECLRDGLLFYNIVPFSRKTVSGWSSYCFIRFYIWSRKVTWWQFFCRLIGFPYLSVLVLYRLIAILGDAFYLIIYDIGHERVPERIISWGVTKKLSFTSASELSSELMLSTESSSSVSIMASKRCKAVFLILKILSSYFLSFWKFNDSCVIILWISRDYLPVCLRTSERSLSWRTSTMLCILRS